MKRAEIEDRTIFLSIAGSKAYGLDTPESDTDYKGCFIAQPKHYLGLSTIEQKDKGWDIPDQDPPSLYPFLTNTDTSIYEVKKFIGLLLNNNPSLLETLFIEEDKYLYVDPLFKQVVDNRRAFLSKKTRHSYAGFAYSQLNRIEMHRSWLFNPPQSPPNAVDYGLTLERPSLTKSQEGAFLEYLYVLIQDTLSVMQDIDELRDMLREKVDIKGALKQRRIPDIAFYYTQHFTNSSDSFMSLLNASQRYKKDLDHWISYQSWKKNRNKERAIVEARCGYDGKHAMNLIRLLTMAVEILTDHTLYVNRKDRGDRDYLLAIKNGSIPYEEIKDLSGKLFSQLEVDNPKGLYQSSTLRHRPDISLAERLCIDIIVSRI